MEIIFSLAIGVLAGSGIYLILRPRTFQLIMGLSLLSYAVNLFIFGMGRLRVGAAPVINPAQGSDPSLSADPVPPVPQPSAAAPPTPEPPPSRRARWR